MHGAHLTSAGAMPIVNSMIGIPTRFDLHVDSKSASHAASVVWKRDNQISVKFAGHAYAAS